MGKWPGSEVFYKIGAESQAHAAPSSPGQTLDSEPPGWWVLLGGSARGCTSSPVALSGFEPGQFVGSAGSGCSLGTGKLASPERSGPCFGLAQAFAHLLGTRTRVPEAGPRVRGLVKLEGCACGFGAREGAGSMWTTSSLPEPHVGQGYPVPRGLSGV